MYNFDLGDLGEHLLHLSTALSYKIKFGHIYSRVDIRMPAFNAWSRALTKEY